MSTVRLLGSLGFCGCLLPMLTVAAPPRPVAASSGLVAFSSSINEVMHGDRRGGTFTIKCGPRSHAHGSTAAWIAECNELGRAAIDGAVDRGLIAPAPGVPFVTAAEVPTAGGITGVSFRRDFDLVAPPSGSPARAR